MNQKTLFYLLLMVLGTVSFVSCGDDDESDSPVVNPSIPSIEKLNANESFYFVGQFSINYTEKSIDIDMTLSVHPDLAKWGYQVTNVTYYFDDVLIGSSSQKPFAISKKVENLKDCKHYMSGKITIEGNGSRCVYTYKQEMGSTDPADAEKVDIDVKYNAVSTGDTFTISAYINKENSEPDLRITKATLYWNDEKVGESKTEPFSISKVVKEKDGETVDIVYSIYYTCAKSSGVNINKYSIKIGESPARSIIRKSSKCIVKE